MRTSDSRGSESTPRADLGEPHPGGSTGSTSECLRPLDVLVPTDVAAVLATIGRTEDIALSPDGTRLLVAGFASNVLALVALEIETTSGKRPVIELTGVTLITDPLLDGPHGVDFIDDHRILIANRASEVLILEVPSRDTGRFGSHNFRAMSRVLLDGESPAPVRTPGSLTVRRFGDIAEVIVCNNYVHDVTRHIIDLAGTPVAIDHEVVLDTGLEIPDGVAISPSGKWLAISNHLTHEILIYRFDEHLQPATEPSVRLGHINYPHGLRFSSDERHLLVADAGLPYINVYHADNGDWSGSRQPTRIVRVMDDETFIRGRHNPQEGGPKGLAFVSDDVVVVTSEEQPLGFFNRQDLFAGPLSPVASDVGGGSIIARATRRLTDAADTIEQLQMQLDEAETAHAATVAAQIAERDAQLAHLARTCDAVRAELTTVTRRHHEQVHELLATHRAHADLAAETIALHETRRLEAEAEAAQAVAAVEAISGSTAWRATAPARAALDVVRRRQR